jgi:fucose permease
LTALAKPRSLLGRDSGFIGSRIKEREARINRGNLGRKPVMLLAVVAALAALLALVHTGPDVAALFGLVGSVSGLVLSLMALTIGPVSAEAVPAKLMSTASGLVVGIGEIFGGGVAPCLAGFGAKHFGIGCALYIPIGALCCGLVAVAFLKETGPNRQKVSQTF